MELSASHRERSLSGPLIALLELLAEESQGAAPAGVVMPEPVAPGDVAAAIDSRGFFCVRGRHGQGGMHRGATRERLFSSKILQRKPAAPWRDKSAVNTNKYLLASSTCDQGPVVRSTFELWVRRGRLRKVRVLHKTVQKGVGEAHL